MLRPSPPARCLPVVRHDIPKFCGCPYAIDYQTKYYRQQRQPAGDPLWGGGSDGHFTGAVDLLFLPCTYCSTDTDTNGVYLWRRISLPTAPDGQGLTKTYEQKPSYGRRCCSTQFATHMVVENMIEPFLAYRGHTAMPRLLQTPRTQTSAVKQKKAHIMSAGDVKYVSYW